VSEQNILVGSWSAHELAHTQSTRRIYSHTLAGSPTHAPQKIEIHLVSPIYKKMHEYWKLFYFADI
jgi:hypothetical protein